MESSEYLEWVASDIRKRIIDMRRVKKLTSKGEMMSMAAIGRTLDPPVTRVSVYLVVDGKAESHRIKNAIEREIGKAYWIKKV